MALYLLKSSRIASSVHSFPTRRSSDLPRVEPRRPAGRVTQWGERDPTRGRGEDRKSTRLNSSHEWNSYAVFCLKKKSVNGTLDVEGDPRCLAAVELYAAGIADYVHTVH